MSRVLIAEDDPHILRVISLWLSRQGHEILEARNGALALELFQQHGADIVVTDVNMPAMDGLELVERILDDPGCVRGIVMLTNRWDHGELRERQGHASVHVLPKPFSPTKLSDLIQKIAAQEPIVREPEVPQPQRAEP